LARWITIYPLHTIPISGHKKTQQLPGFFENVDSTQLHVIAPDTKVTAAAYN